MVLAPKLAPDGSAQCGIRQDAPVARGAGKPQKNLTFRCAPGQVETALSAFRDRPDRSGDDSSTKFDELASPPGAEPGTKGG